MPNEDVLRRLRNLATSMALLRDELRLLLLNDDSLIKRREGLDPFKELDIISDAIDEVDDSLEQMQKSLPARSNQEARGL